MSGHQHDSWSSGGGTPSAPGTIVRRFHEPSSMSGPTTPATLGGLQDEAGAGVMAPGGALDALVDAVVERVEQRVIDELERRGRRQDWAAF